MSGAGGASSGDRLDEALEQLIGQLADDVRFHELRGDHAAARAIRDHAVSLLAERGELALRRLEQRLGLQPGALGRRNG